MTSFLRDLDRVLRSDQGRRLLDEARRLASTEQSKQRIDALRRRVSGRPPAPDRPQG